MKIPILFLIIASAFTNAFAQTFRNGFDNYESGLGGGFGQGLSYHSDVAGELNNGESIYLQSYLTMFKATKDKRYLDKFIIHSKRVQERRDDNILSISNQVEGFSAHFYDDNGNLICTIPSVFSLNDQKKEDSVMLRIAWGFNASSTYEVSNGQNGDLKYAFGFYAKFRPSNKFNFNIGLSYDRLQDHTNLSLNYNNSVLHRTIVCQYTFLNMPLSFSYQLNKRKFKPFVDAGMQASILVQNKFTFDDEMFHSKEKLFNNGSFSAFYDFGFGVIYKIKSNVDCTFNINYYNSFIPLIREYRNQLGETVLEEENLAYYKINIGLLFYLLNSTNKCNFWSKKIIFFKEREKENILSPLYPDGEILFLSLSFLKKLQNETSHQRAKIRNKCNENKKLFTQRNSRSYW